MQIIIFSLSIILSAFLLFWIELLFAKQVLPHLGGVPAAWNGCMFFFQGTLLLGYWWAFILKNFGQSKYQQIIQTTLLLVCCIFFPFNLRTSSWFQAEEQPLLWLLSTAFQSVGLPFFLLSSLTPTLQNWFAQCTHKVNPYVLYTVSNIGSMSALLTFPFVLETSFSIKQQSILWQNTFWLNTILVVVACLYTYIYGKKMNSQVNLAQSTDRSVSRSHQEKPKWQNIFRWVLWSFVPSSLLLGTTSYITTELAPIPLLWALPLTIYLFSFIFYQFCEY